MKNNIFWLSLLFIIKSISSQIDDMDNEEAMLKKSKVLACIAITKARMAKDVNFIGDLVKNINTHFKIEDGKNKVLSLCLVNCYSKISEEKAFELITSMHGDGDVDPLTPDNKELLGLQDSETSANAINKESFVQDFQEINLILKDLNKEHDQMKKSPRTEKPQETKKTSQTSKKESSSNTKKQTTNSKNSKDYGKTILSVISDYFIGFFSIFYTIGKFIALDNTIGIAIMIIGSFFLLNILKNMCVKKKKVIRKVAKAEGSGEKFSGEQVVN